MPENVQQTLHSLTSKVFKGPVPFKGPVDYCTSNPRTLIHLVIHSLSRPGAEKSQGTCTYCRNNKFKHDNVDKQQEDASCLCGFCWSFSFTAKSDWLSSLLLDYSNDEILSHGGRLLRIPGYLSQMCLRSSMECFHPHSLMRMSCSVLAGRRWGKKVWV